MTNEQTAMMLSGIKNDLRQSIESLKLLIDPTMIQGSDMSIAFGGAKEVETYPELADLNTLASRLESDLCILTGTETES